MNQKSSKPKINKKANPSKTQNTKPTKIEHFKDMALEPELQSFLDTNKFKTPTFVQKKIIPLILAGKDVIYADQTGTGKSFGSLIALVQRLRGIIKKVDLKDSLMLNPTSPQAIVIAPTLELAEQLLSCAKMISHTAKFKSCLLSKSFKPGVQTKHIKSGAHLVIGTPSTILKHVKMRNISLSQVKIAAIDEVDVLFDRSFCDEMGELKRLMSNKFAAKPPFNFTQFICSSSTLSLGSLKYLQKEFPYAIPVLTKNHHHQPKELSTEFLELRGRDKLQSLLGIMEEQREKLLTKSKEKPKEKPKEKSKEKPKEKSNEKSKENSKENPNDFKRTIIFTRGSASCKAVQAMISFNGFNSVPLYHDLDRKSRRDNYTTWKSGGCNILVTTDLASRGLDTDCELVIMADFSENSTEYIHRAGRTARMGGPGKVIALLTNKDVPLARKIQYCQKTNKSVEGLISSKGKAQELEDYFKKVPPKNTSPFYLTKGFKPLSEVEEPVGYKQIKSDKKFKHEQERLSKFMKEQSVSNAKSGFKWHYTPGQSRVPKTFNATERKKVMRNLNIVNKTFKKTKRLTNR